MDGLVEKVAADMLELKESGHANDMDIARAAIEAVFDALEERANVAQAVRGMIGADHRQQIALEYAEAEFRSRLITLRKQALG